MIQTLVITDTETTGLDPATDKCIEVAVALYSVPTATVTTVFSSLIYAEENAAEAVNHISVEALKLAPKPEAVWPRVSRIVERAAASGLATYVAHRAEFDQGFYPKETANTLRWTCSMFDIEWPKSKLGASLVGVALAHGVPVHDNHRALTDVMLLAKTFQAVHKDGHDVQAMLARAMRPKAKYVALVSYDDREKAKAAGFSWDSTCTIGSSRGSWVRQMAIEDVGALPFKTRELQP